MRSNLVATVVLLGAASMVGCGEHGKYSSPEATFETAWMAAKAGDRAALRECFDKASQGELREIEKIREEIGEAPNLNVRKALGFLRGAKKVIEKLKGAK